MLKKIIHSLFLVHLTFILSGLHAFSFTSDAGHLQQEAHFWNASDSQQALQKAYLTHQKDSGKEIDLEALEEEEEKHNSLHKNTGQDFSSPVVSQHIKLYTPHSQGWSTQYNPFVLESFQRLILFQVFRL